LARCLRSRNRDKHPSSLVASLGSFSISGQYQTPGDADDGESLALEHAPGEYEIEYDMETYGDWLCEFHPIQDGNVLGIKNFAQLNI
jgi:hypothetical protein